MEISKCSEADSCIERKKRVEETNKGEGIQLRLISTKVAFSCNTTNSLKSGVKGKRYKVERAYSILYKQKH